MFSCSLFSEMARSATNRTKSYSLVLIYIRDLLQMRPCMMSPLTHSGRTWPWRDVSYCLIPRLSSQSVRILFASYCSEGINFRRYPQLPTCLHVRQTRRQNQSAPFYHNFSYIQPNLNMALTLYFWKYVAIFELLFP